jgi:hypothetical protein
VVVAGNRYGLPNAIKAPAGAGNLWQAFAEAMRKAKAPAAVSVSATAATVPPVGTSGSFTLV